ncbi:MAG: hypothetical protein JO086_04810 [Acidimicrobiia bacterium]|nr:hypothetical protein [Acidimicrobiia bacterium]
MTRRVAIGLAAVAVLVVVAIATTRGGSHRTVPLFIFAGQSNMVGAGARFSLAPPALARPDKRVEYWDDAARAWTTAIPAGDIPGAFGPDVTALRELASKLGTKVAAVKVAVNGSSLVTEWDPSKPDGLYVRLQNAVSDALTVPVGGNRAKVAGVFWMQGETDGINTDTSAVYDSNLRGLIDHVRRDLGNNALPFVLGRVRLSEQYSFTVRAAQDDIARLLPKVKAVDTDDLTLADGLHYDTTSVQTLGRRMADAYLSLRS